VTSQILPAAISAFCASMMKPAFLHFSRATCTSFHRVFLVSRLFFPSLLGRLLGEIGLSCNRPSDPPPSTSFECFAFQLDLSGFRSATPSGLDSEVAPPPGTTPIAAKSPFFPLDSREVSRPRLDAPPRPNLHQPSNGFSPPPVSTSGTLNVQNFSPPRSGLQLLLRTVPTYRISLGSHPQSRVSPQRFASSKIIFFSNRCLRIFRFNLILPFFSHSASWAL